MAGNPLFDPFMDSLRVAVPIFQQQKQLDFEKAKTDQAFKLREAEILKAATDVETKRALDVTLEAIKLAAPNTNPDNPAAVKNLMGLFSNAEKLVGQPVMPRDASGLPTLEGLVFGKKTDAEPRLYETNQGWQPAGKAVGLQKPEKPPVTINPYQERKLENEDRSIALREQESAERKRKNQVNEQGTKPPKDHVFDPADGTMKLIPGTPTYVKQRAEYSKDTASLDSIGSKLDNLSNMAMQLAQDPGLSGITGVTGWVPDRPGSAAANARAKLKSIGSQVATQAIQEMRAMSKTGGALGNTSDADIELLKSSIDTLMTSQDEESLRRALEHISDVARASKNRLAAAYQRQWGDWEDRVFNKKIEDKNLEINTADDFLKKYEK